MVLVEWCWSSGVLSSTPLVVNDFASAALHTLEYAGINVKKWLHGFDSVSESVANRCAGVS